MASATFTSSQLCVPRPGALSFRNRVCASARPNASLASGKALSLSRAGLLRVASCRSAANRKHPQPARAVAGAVTEQDVEGVDDGKTGKYDQELSVAAEAVRAASVLCQAVQERIISRAEEANIKDDASPVTVADYGAQAVISYLIQREFPEVKLSLIAEEGSEELLSDGGATLAKVMVAVNETLIGENLIDGTDYAL